MRIIRAEAKADRATDIRRELRAHGLGFIIPGSIGVIPVATRQIARHAHRHVFSNRKVERCGCVVAIEVAVFAHHEPTEFANAWSRSDYIDRPAGRILAVQNSLRALQNFNPLQIVEHAVCRLAAYQRHAVNIERNGRVALGIGGEVANTAKVEGVGRTRDGADLQGRSDLGKLVGVGDARTDELFRINRGQHDGGVLQVLGAALRCNGNDSQTTGRPTAA